MMINSVALVASGGALGAVLRFATVTAIQNLFGNRFPYGTLLVNSLGCFLAGILMILLLERLAVGGGWRLFLMVGFLGGYTTFSSFSWETWMLFISNEPLLAWLNILLNNLLSLLFALMGIQLGRWMGGSF